MRKTFDRFHVQKLANETRDTMRQQEVNRLAGSDEGKALKKSRWALLKNPWSLTLRQGQKLSELKETNQPLYWAYLLKESVARGMDYRQPKRASEQLDSWCQWASHCQLERCRWERSAPPERKAEVRFDGRIHDVFTGGAGMNEAECREIMRVHDVLNIFVTEMLWACLQCQRPGGGEPSTPPRRLVSWRA